MFGMGFTEILLIAVIAILFIGPEKLPSAMVEVAKFFRNTKNAIGSVKETIEDEMHLSEMKQEALAYKEELERTTTKISDEASYLNNRIIDDNMSADFKKASQKEKVEEVEEVTLKKEKKIEDV